MNLDTWFSWYREILDDFGFSRVDDEKSAETLNSLLDNQNPLQPSDITINDKVIVFGAGPSLKKNINDLKKINIQNYTLIAADGATTALLEEKITPDIIVTDLDGKMDDIVKANNEGSILVIHAHGNNRDNIKRYFPGLKNILGTTQSVPMDRVYNLGGFTDGDRCIFLAIVLGAKKIVLAGMDFGKIITRYSRPDLSNREDKADRVKQKKLEYASRLTQWAAENEDVDILNISHGEKLENVEEIDVSELMD